MKDFEPFVDKKVSFKGGIDANFACRSAGWMKFRKIKGNLMRLRGVFFRKSERSRGAFNRGSGRNIQFDKKKVVEETLLKLKL